MEEIKTIEVKKRTVSKNVPEPLTEYVVYINGFEYCDYPEPPNGDDMKWIIESYLKGETITDDDIMMRWWVSL